MTPYELMETVLTSVATDQSVSEYAISEYGRAPGVFDLYSGDFPPEPDLCPYILIHAAGKTAGHESRDITYKISVDIFVYDSEDEIRADAAAVSSGPRRLAGLQSRVMSAILGGLPQSVFTAISQSDEVSELYPLMISVMDMTFSERVCIGVNPLAV